MMVVHGAVDDRIGDVSEGGSRDRVTGIPCLVGHVEASLSELGG